MYNYIGPFLQDLSDWELVLNHLIALSSGPGDDSITRGSDGQSSRRTLFSHMLSTLSPHAVHMLLCGAILKCEDQILQEEFQSLLINHSSLHTQQRCFDVETKGLL